MHFDLIVIGMGLTGLMAAKTAAERKKKVLLIGKGFGTLTLFSNTIDLMGILPEEVPVKESLPPWIEEHPDHPYGKVGMEKIEEALSSFLSFFPPPYTFHSRNGANSLVPTGAGTLRPTYLIPSTMMKGIGLREKKGLIVGFKGYKDFYAHRFSDLFRCRAMTVDLEEAHGAEMSATTLARWMEEPSFRQRLTEGIKKEWRGEPLLGFPALLGLRDPMVVRRDLEKRTGASVFEIPVLPPSMPGMRIFNTFREKLIQMGVTFLLGQSVSRPLLRGDRCEGVEVTHAPRVDTYTGERILMATGRFIGGGLRADSSKIEEPLLGLPVAQPPSRKGWFEEAFLASSGHPVHRAGVVVDSMFRPLDERGTPIFENVWVAGTLLAHHDFLYEKSKEGIEIATGYAAALKALVG